jgi:hypothetical protein
VKAGDGDDWHSWSSKESVGFGRKSDASAFQNLLLQQTEDIMHGLSFYAFIIQLYVQNPCAFPATSISISRALESRFAVPLR